MATKSIYEKDQAREIFLKGVNKIANPVITTLGAKGKTVAIAGKYRTVLSKDGVSIVKAIQLTDEEDIAGANLVKEVAVKTLKQAGDSTTCATLLTQVIIQEGFKLLAAGHNGHALKAGIDKAVDEVVKHLGEMSEKITVDSPKLKQIATISANNDEFIGTIVADAYAQVGKDGIVSLDDSRTGKTYLEAVKGMQFEKGYLMPNFINNEENLSCQLNNPYILLSEGKITMLKEIKSILEQVIAEDRSILIIAEDVEGDALYNILHNIQASKGQFKVCIVKAPGFGDNKKEQLKDIAAVVGATVASETTGSRLDLLKLTDLGSAEKILITKDTTTIVGGKGEFVEARVKYIHKQIELNTSEDPFDKEQLEKRLAKLSGGIAVLYVGAPTEMELNELKDRCDDSLRATKCAIEEGIVPGGGVAFIRCADKCIKNVSDWDKTENAGMGIIWAALYKPFKQMVINAGVEIIPRDINNDNPNYGYNFKTNKFEDLVESGVIDAVKSLRVALVNASSAAGTLLTSDSLIIQEGSPNLMMPNLGK